MALVQLCVDQQWLALAWGPFAYWGVVLSSFMVSRKTKHPVNNKKPHASLGHNCSVLSFAWANYSCRRPYVFLHIETWLSLGVLWWTVKTLGVKPFDVASGNTPGVNMPKTNKFCLVKVASTEVELGAQWPKDPCASISLIRPLHSYVQASWDWLCLKDLLLTGHEKTETTIYNTVVNWISNALRIWNHSRQAAAG